MNKLLTVALLAQGATAFAPAKQPLSVAGQRDGELRPGLIDKILRLSLDENQMVNVDLDAHFEFGRNYGYNP